MDGTLALQMALLLHCVAMTTSFEDAESLVGTISAASFVLVFLAISGIAFDIDRRHAPSPLYQYFVCHAKTEAATQARFKRLLLEQKLQRGCFLDTDGLVTSTSSSTSVSLVGWWFTLQ